MIRFLRAPSIVLACSIALALVSTTSAVAAPTAQARGGGFDTAKRPFLVALAPGVSIDPILTTGDVVGGMQDGYQMSGVPDGLGAYSRGPGSFELFMNHELNGAFDPSDARVSHLTLSSDARVQAARYALDGSERFEWFCSSTLAILGDVPWYFTGEESSRSEHNGSSIALNAATGVWTETPHFGHTSHENIVPIKGLDRAMMAITEDGFGEPSQLYAYTAARFTAAIRGHGSLRAFVPNDPVPDGNPSTNDIQKGEVLEGHFERFANKDNFDHKTLEKAAQRKGAMDFSRLEDLTADPNNPGTMYFAETGVAHQETIRGRVYKLEPDPTDPDTWRLSVVLDSADGDDIFSPDNLGISDEALVIQEDRNWSRSGFNRVLVYDLSSGTLTPVARADPPADLVAEEGPGVWESSGVVDASEFFGDGWWLVDVQAHDTFTRWPGTDLQIDSARGESGQLLRMWIPGT